MVDDRVHTITGVARRAGQLPAMHQADHQLRGANQVLQIQDLKRVEVRLSGRGHGLYFLSCAVATSDVPQKISATSCNSTVYEVYADTSRRTSASKAAAASEVRRSRAREARPWNDSMYDRSIVEMERGQCALHHVCGTDGAAPAQRLCRHARIYRISSSAG